MSAIQLLQNGISGQVTMSSLFQGLPGELHLNILECRADLVISEVVNKDIFSNGDMKEAGRTLVEFSLISKYSKNLFDIRLSDIKKIFQLYHKYRAYGDFDPFGNEIVPCGNTQLLDLLGTGKQKLKRSFMVFAAEQLAEDMEQIIKLMPRSMTCDKGGKLFGYHLVSPLAIACYNQKIPIQTIELLIKKGANPTLIWEGTRMHILTLAKKFQCPAPCPKPGAAKRVPTPYEIRLEQLKKVFEKYDEEYLTCVDSLIDGHVGHHGGGTHSYGFI